MGHDTIKAVGVNVCVWVIIHQLTGRRLKGHLMFFFLPHSIPHTPEAWSLTIYLVRAPSTHRARRQTCVHAAHTHAHALTHTRTFLNCLLKLLTGKNEPWAEFTSLKSKVSCSCKHFKATTVNYFSSFYFFFNGISDRESGWIWGISITADLWSVAVSKGLLLSWPHQCPSTGRKWKTDPSRSSVSEGSERLLRICFGKRLVGDKRTWCWSGKTLFDLQAMDQTEMNMLEKMFPRLEPPRLSRLRDMKQLFSPSSFLLKEHRQSVSIDCLQW